MEVQRERGGKKKKGGEHQLGPSYQPLARTWGGGGVRRVACRPAGVVPPGEGGRGPAVSSRSRKHRGCNDV